LFAFAFLASGMPLTAAMGHEPYVFVNALEKLQPPEFDHAIRKTLTGFAFRWISSMSSVQSNRNGAPPAPPNANGSAAL
jgi:hypothetical protein